MKSQTLPSFWDNYKLLTEKTRRSARKADRLWKENPFHLRLWDFARDQLPTNKLSVTSQNQKLRHKPITPLCAWSDSAREYLKAHIIKPM